MTRNELFKMIFPEVYTEPDKCLGIACNDPSGCNECEYHNYWNEPAVISKDAIKNILNSLYGINAFYGLTVPKIYNDTHSIFKPAYQHLELIKEGWEKLPSIHNNIDWPMLKDIIDDALDNGFEVKILNGTIYYREKQ